MSDIEDRLARLKLHAKLDAEAGCVRTSASTDDMLWTLERVASLESQLEEARRDIEGYKAADEIMSTALHTREMELQELRAYRCPNAAFVNELTDSRGSEMTMQISDNGVPRRIRADLYTPAEKAIRDAVEAVEAAGAHPRLTDAVVLLQQAHEACADGVEALGQTSSENQK